jgi:AAA+ ATPase superfamily predicted ATPase
MYNAPTYKANPFLFGSLAYDDVFVDREDELRALAGDFRSGQDVLLLAPRRLGKSSLVFRAVQDAAAEGMLVAYCDLLRTPTKARFAAALAETILDDLSSPAGGLVERAAALVRGLRVRPTIEIDPDDGRVRFVFEPTRSPRDLDDTLERLLELPGRIAAERKRRTVLVLDEFQEVVRLDEALPGVMRSIFQTQPEVCHVYLGSKRHILESLFDDRNQPFWHSARHMGLGRIPHAAFAPYLRARFEATERDVDDEAVALLLEITDGHPYATQELAFFTWTHVPHGHAARVEDVRAGLADVLNAEHNNLARIWDGATQNERLVLLALRAGPRSIYAEETRRTAGLPSPTFVQRAVGALVREDVVEKQADGRYAICEPFFTAWLEREQTGLRPQAGDA